MSSSVTPFYLRTKGVLPVQKLRLLKEFNVIRTPDDYPLEPGQFQPNSPGSPSG